ncbi:hypothetical protein Acsp06_16520 [Actinomycetospora sp. NBRC 106375]|uniref:hypothetical protein n=1 Tax=Actinomycetospora sp. NBRC 106375 TaxID=3032207 RepID=UPI0024A3CEC2|nr:hypothetical protein [Actinomycetospora sp. NBRC 106375]GLZ45467.1 hypothetical protein Acsp06_16520 [Actinomycetospora sp. NBRC 106375]
MPATETAPQPGAVAPELLAEYGDLGLWWVCVDVARRSADAGRDRLRRLSDDYRPREALTPGGRPATHDAARAFARQVGLDPDATLLRPDAAARAAAMAGRLVPAGAVADALLAVAVTSGVTVTAVDAARVDGPPVLRTAADGELLGRGRRARAVSPGTVVVADHQRVLAPLFADPPRALDPHRARRVLVWAVEVPGAPPLETEEAVWHAGRFLSGR